MTEDRIQHLIAQWRAQAVVVDGNTTCVNHAFYQCADELEALFAAERPPPQEGIALAPTLSGDPFALGMLMDDLGRQRDISERRYCEVLQALRRLLGEDAIRADHAGLVQMIQDFAHNSKSVVGGLQPTVSASATDSYPSVPNGGDSGQQRAERPPPQDAQVGEDKEALAIADKLDSYWRPQSLYSPLKALLADASEKLRALAKPLGSPTP